MKKIINDTADIVDQSLAGFVRAHAGLVTSDAEHRLCLRAGGPTPGKVALLSGGGSGHEPLHAGFVGRGMLDGAILGDIFASPTTEQVLTAIRAADSGAGVLLIVKNYTGDVINFRAAARTAKREGREVEIVIVDDDVATRSTDIGGRGTGATVFVEKIAGALAERGASLADVAAVASRVIERARSVGVALQPCTTPMAGRPTFDLADDEIEFGVGIHGEAGIERRKHVAAATLATDMVGALLDGPDASAGGDLIVLVNGLGATPPIELYLLFGEVAQVLDGRGHGVARSLVGNYITSLDMAGVTLSVVQADDQMLELWDAPVDTAAWSSAGHKG
jgi:dihydroxyacetone kinase-like protein